MRRAPPARSNGSQQAARGVAIGAKAKPPQRFRQGERVQLRDPALDRYGEPWSDAVVVDPMRALGNGYAIVVVSHGHEFTVPLEADGRPAGGRVTKAWEP